MADKRWQDLIGAYRICRSLEDLNLSYFPLGSLGKTHKEPGKGSFGKSFAYWDYARFSSRAYARVLKKGYARCAYERE